MGGKALFIDPNESSTVSGRTPAMYRDPGQHIEILGASGSGKTSTLLKVTYNLWKVGETVIWRDDQNLEFLSFLNKAPIRLWQPNGCDLLLRHPSIEKQWYDWQSPMEMMPRFTGDRLNVILFDLFTLDHALTVEFWTDFFECLYQYKRMRIDEAWSLVIDEFNDLAPGKNRGRIRGQSKLSNAIFSSMKKFRKMWVRLVASTHNWNDIHAPIRGQFMYYIYKATRRENVPERFLFYATNIENMEQNQCIIVDRRGRHQFVGDWNEQSRSHLNPAEWITLKPARTRVPWTGEVRKPTKEESGRRADLWKTRAILGLRVIKDLFSEIGRDFGYREIAALFDLSISPSHTYDQLSETIPPEAWQRQLELADLSVAEYNVERARRQLEADMDPRVRSFLQEVELGEGETNE